MKNCSHCGSEVADSARFCPSCGEPAGAFGELPTEAPPTPASGGKKSSPPAPTPPHVSSSSDFSSGRFAPGEMLAGRYRILGRLGRGGMGEVYRADDLTLGQPVALKFLPTASVQDSGFIERFRAEVRNARGVSHPNVCRVYDIGEVNGEQFISMEYVDGEDLSTLLRRIGRLPPAKALEIARQLCAGLAAAHDKGVLHRDLKPANIMIDGQGRARITDFGLAVTGEEAATDGRIAGTPAYMAPEQLAGRGATAKSDIYSLGLVFYEIFTGKRAFEGATLAELRRQHSDVQPKALSSHITDIDPATERVILRCLEKDPKLRPATALAVAAALPGGDPLAAALAAGETPSPDLVAAAGETEGFKPRTAIACLAFIIAGIVAFSVLNPKLNVTGIVPLGSSPEVLAAKTRDLIRQFGYTATPVDSTFRYKYDLDYLRYIEDHDKSRNRWEQLKTGFPSAIEFWYRASPRYLEAQNLFGGGMVGEDDPPRDVSGMTFAVMDPGGRLEYFEAVPPQREQSGSGSSSGDAGLKAGATTSPDWAALFKAAGLDMSQFKSVEPEWIPPQWSDARAAWTGAAPERPDVPLRVEAAAYRGKPIYFQLIWPWTRAGRMQAYEQRAGLRFAQAVELVFFLGVLIGALWLVRRNLRLGRGDRRGAFRLAIFAFLLFMGSSALLTHHLPTSYEFGLFVIGTSWALFLGAIVWLFYIGLEPYVRRRWPNSIISWSRVLAGQWRDPLVGRDLLLGVALGVAVDLWFQFGQLAENRFGKLPPQPATPSPLPLLGVHASAALILNDTGTWLGLALALFFLFFLLRLGLRKDWAAGVVFVVINGAIALGANTLVEVALVTAIFAAFVFILLRFGFFPLVVLFVVQDFLGLALTTHLGAWYASSTIVGVVFVLALGIYGFKTSLGGQAIFSGAALDE
jgi:serine/threonine protein kinase